MTTRYEVRDGIAYLSFNRDERHNALRDEDLQAVIDGILRMDADDEVQVGIIHGNGRSFSSGGDVQARLQASVNGPDKGGRTNEGPTFHEVANWKPIIAAVHGYCLGHAMGTALHCDLLVAARNAVFQVTEIKIGLPMPSLLARIPHQAFANEVCLTGRMFGAEEAWHAGMVTRLVDEGQQLVAAQELARQIMANPQGGVREHVKARRAMLGAAAGRYQAITAAYSSGWASNSEARDAVNTRAADKA